MRRSISLALKLTFGFGSVILVAVVLGIVGWQGVGTINRTFRLASQGNEALDRVNTTGALRRDFAIHGFTPPAGQSVSADVRWQEAYEKMVEQMETVRQAKGIKNEHRGLVERSLSISKDYKAAFGEQKRAQKLKDDAFAEWGKIGWAITGEVDKLLKETVEPQLEDAAAKRDASRLAFWSSVAHSLDQNVVKPFLVLRITAVYLVATDADAQWKGFQDQLQKAKAGLNRWISEIRGNAQLEQLASAISGQLSLYEQAGDRYYEGVQLKRSSGETLASTAEGIVEQINQLEEGLQHQMESISASTAGIVLTVTIVGVLLGVLLAFLITRSIVRPINEIIGTLRSGSEQVASASEQLSASSEQLSENANEQASSLEEVSSSLEEITSMTRQNGDNAVQVNGLMTNTNDQVKHGLESMQSLGSAISQIKESSDATAHIIKTIDEIAMQTNLLALNAAVEAARAGEAGRGFAVVAEEVRNLAQRSAEAAKNTASLISEAQKNAENGVGLADTTSNVINEIAQGSGKVAALIAEIAAASKEQGEGIEQINTAVGQMDQVTQQNAASAEESSSASEELSSQAQTLNAMVAELVTLIHGGNSRASDVHHETRPQPGPALRHSSSQPNRRKSSPAPKLVQQTKSPNEIIPLDEDYGDF